MFALLSRAARSLAADRKGVAALEYGIIAGLVAAAIVAGTGTVGIAGLSQSFARLGCHLDEPGAPCKTMTSPN